MTATLTDPVVTFLVANRDFAFAVSDVIEMLSARVPTAVPGASPRLAGVTSWRGRTLPVLDLVPALKLEDPSPDSQKRLLVLRRPAPFALKVDEPGRIVDPDDIESIELEGGDAEREAREFGIQLIRCSGRLVRVLDPVRVLGDEPLVIRPDGHEEGTK